MYIGNGISTMDNKDIFAVSKGLAIQMRRWGQLWLSLSLSSPNIGGAVKFRARIWIKHN